MNAPGQKVRLGRGEVVGEIALLTGRPRQADVYAIGYCSFLRLAARDFQKFLTRHPTVRQHIESVARQRVAANEDAVQAR